METFQESFPSKPLRWPADKTWAISGVVGSGNLEVLIERNSDSDSTAFYDVQTSIPGFQESWLEALHDFSTHYAVGGAKFTLHDQGAAPVVIKMRLRQALDLLTASAS